MGISLPHQPVSIPLLITTWHPKLLTVLQRPTTFHDTMASHMLHCLVCPFLPACKSRCPPWSPKETEYCLPMLPLHSGLCVTYSSLHSTWEQPTHQTFLNPGAWDSLWHVVSTKMKFEVSLPRTNWGARLGNSSFRISGIEELPQCTFLRGGSTAIWLKGQALTGTDLTVFLSCAYYPRSSPQKKIKS